MTGDEVVLYIYIQIYYIFGCVSHIKTVCGWVEPIVIPKKQNSMNHLADLTVVLLQIGLLQ